MTVIIAIKDEETKEVWMGADGRLSTTYNFYPAKHSKIFRLGKMLLGCSGSTRASQVISFSQDYPVFSGREEELPLFLSITFSSWVRKILEENQALEVFKEEKSKILLGLEGCLFMLDSQFGLVESCRNYDAIGSGAEIALGSLHSTQKDVKLNLQQRIDYALKASVEFDSGVGPPFDIEKL